MNEAFISQYNARIEQALDRYLPAPDVHPAALHQAMRYAVLNGGKRIRPVLVYATGNAVGVPLTALDGPASAVELIHAYSLVHDDLPAMDNDELRRGKPTCHKAFGEATALLVGDALQTLAFQVLSQESDIALEPASRLRLIATLAQAAGSRGMAGGQAIDLQAVGKTLNLAELEDMHIHKTGALIRASVLLGALSQPSISESALAALDHYAKRIGLAFQIRDDILDLTADVQTLGKQPGGDAAAHKPTYPALMGLGDARDHLQSLCQEALASLADWDSAAEELRWIARYIAEQSH